MVANPVTGKLTLVHSAETSESHPEHSADKNLIYDVFEAADVSKEKSAANFRAFESSVELLICLHSRKHLDINTATVVSAGAEGWIRAWSLNPKVGRISVGLEFSRARVSLALSDVETGCWKRGICVLLSGLVVGFLIIPDGLEAAYCCF